MPKAEAWSFTSCEQLAAQLRTLDWKAKMREVHSENPDLGPLTAIFHSQGSPQKVGLSGTGTVMTISPLDINFGNQGVGTHSSPVPVQLKNVGQSSVEIDDITIKGTDATDFSQTNNCGHSLAGGGTCTIQVTFTPKAKGKRSASLEVNDNGGGSPQKVALTGTGT
jgi:hypothetical protein